MKPCRRYNVAANRTGTGFRRLHLSPSGMKYCTLALIGKLLLPVIGFFSSIVSLNSETKAMLMKSQEGLNISIMFTCKLLVNVQD